MNAHLLRWLIAVVLCSQVCWLPCAAQSESRPKMSQQVRDALLRQENGQKPSAEERKAIDEYRNKLLEHAKAHPESKSPSDNPENLKLTFKKQDGESLTPEEQKQYDDYCKKVSDYLAEETAKSAGRVSRSSQSAFDALDDLLKEERSKDKGGKAKSGFDELQKLLKEEQQKDRDHAVPTPADEDFPRPSPYTFSVQSIGNNSRALMTPLGAALGVPSALDMQVSGDGKSTRAMTITLTNLTPLTCLVTIPAGTFFNPADKEHYQTMMITQNTTAAVPPIGSVDITVPSICADSKTLLPPGPLAATPTGSSPGTHYSVGSHKDEQTGAFASSAMNVIATEDQNGTFKGVLMFEGDPQSALQMTVWSHVGATTASRADDINAKSIETDLCDQLVGSLGRPVSSEEKQQLKPTIVALLKTVDLCQKNTQAKVASGGQAKIASPSAIFLK